MYINVRGYGHGNQVRQSSETGNIWYRRHKMETKKKQFKNQHRMFWRPLYANKHKTSSGFPYIDLVC